MEGVCKHLAERSERVDKIAFSDLAKTLREEGFKECGTIRAYYSAHIPLLTAVKEPSAKDEMEKGEDA